MRQMGLKGVIRGKSDPDDGQRRRGTMPSRSGQPAVQGTAAERLVGQRLHLWCASSRMVRGAYVWNAMRKEEVKNALPPAVRGHEPKRR